MKTHWQILCAVGVAALGTLSRELLDDSTWSRILGAIAVGALIYATLLFLRFVGRDEDHRDVLSRFWDR